MQVLTLILADGHGERRCRSRLLICAERPQVQGAEAPLLAHTNSIDHRFRVDARDAQVVERERRKVPRIEQPTTRPSGGLPILRLSLADSHPYDLKVGLRRNRVRHGRKQGGKRPTGQAA